MPISNIDQITTTKRSIDHQFDLLFINLGDLVTLIYNQLLLFQHKVGAYYFIIVQKKRENLDFNVE